MQAISLQTGNVIKRQHNNCNINIIEASKHLECISQPAIIAKKKCFKRTECIVKSSKKQPSALQPCCWFSLRKVAAVRKII